MGSSLSKLCFLFLAFFFANHFVYGQDIKGHDTTLHLLEGNTTGSPFDSDGTDFDIFSYLFIASSRTHRLEDIPGKITVLAPDDNAFRRAVGDLGLTTTSELETYENFIIYLMQTYRYPFDLLKRILYYHVIPGEFNSTSLFQMPSLVTWDESLRIIPEGNTLIDRDPEMPNPNFEIARSDIQASNGVIHVIDYVLFPEVMRKLGVLEADNRCITPEPTLEETEPDSKSASFPNDGALNPTPIEDFSIQTDETDQSADGIPVGPMLSPETGESNSPVQGPKDPTPSRTASQPLLSEDRTREEAVRPSQEFTAEAPDGIYDLEESMLHATPQTSSETNVPISPLSSDDVLGAGMPSEENVNVAMASASPIPSHHPSQADEAELEKAGILEPPLEQEASASRSPMDPDESPKMVDDSEGQSQFLFARPIPETLEETVIESPTTLELEVTTNPDESPEIMVDDEGPFTFPFVGPIPVTPK